VVKIIKGHVYNAKNPLVVGVDVLRGCAVVGTPLCVPDKLVSLGFLGFGLFVVLLFCWVSETDT
jgi:translation initiation factor IF-2